ncbi:MAG TPA: T9SS type A sorting domain-containing protein, partial [Caldithrix abyssi]|nr:T9SS type A sorting domain-containing protein [Caldithrix abyssi]
NAYGINIKVDFYGTPRPQGTAWDIGAIEYNNDSTNTTVMTDKPDISLPEKYSLSSYPNPFNPSTNIHYSLPQGSYVQLTIYDITGKKVAELVNDYQQAGEYELTWHAENSFGQQLASGLYFVRIQAGKYMKILKMMYIR